MRHRLETGATKAGATTVLLWDDTWVRYYEPHIGQAAVAVLETLGFKVELARGRACCGRPAFSRGLLDEAAKLGRHNLALLEGRYAELPIIFLEPSCQAMFLDEYRQLKLPGADHVRDRCMSFEHFAEQAVQDESSSLAGPVQKPIHVAIHAHCHARALTDISVMTRLARRIPGAKAILLDTGCCGMAGAYGMMRSTYDLSRAVAAPLVEKIRALPEGTRVVASGTSCRHQIADLAGVRALHMAELLAMCL